MVLTREAKRNIFSFGETEHILVYIQIAASRMDGRKQRQTAMN